MYIFPERLKYLRVENGLTQKQLANAVGAGERGLQDYELRKCKPGHDAIIKLCQHFNISADYLLGLSDDPRPLYPGEPSPGGQ